MGIKKQSDFILLKNCTLAINNCKVVCEAVREAVCITTRGVDCETIHRAAQINMSSYHLVDQLKLPYFEKVGVYSMNKS